MAFQHFLCVLSAFRHRAPLHCILPGDMWPLWEAVHVGHQVLSDGEEGSGCFPGDPGRSWTSHDSWGTPRWEQADTGEDFSLCQTPARYSKTTNAPSTRMQLIYSQLEGGLSLAVAWAAVLFYSLRVGVLFLLSASTLCKLCIQPKRVFVNVSVKVYTGTAIVQVQQQQSADVFSSSECHVTVELQLRAAHLFGRHWLSGST